MQYNIESSNTTCLSQHNYCYQARVGARKALHWSHWAQLACACMSMAPSDPCSQLSRRKHLLDQAARYHGLTSDSLLWKLKCALIEVTSYG